MEAEKKLAKSSREYIDWLSSSSSSERKTASKPAGRPPSRPLHKFGFRGIEHISNVIYLVRRRNFGGAGDRAKLEYLKTRLILSSTSHRRPEEKSGLNQFLQLVGTIIKKSLTVDHCCRQPPCYLQD